MKNKLGQVRWGTRWRRPTTGLHPRGVEWWRKSLAYKNSHRRQKHQNRTTSRVLQIKGAIFLVFCFKTR